MSPFVGRFAVCDLHFDRELNVFYLYPFVAVDRILIGSRNWCIVTLVNADASCMKMLLQKDAFTEEELKICFGVTLCLLVYRGRCADGKETCKLHLINKG